MTISKPESSEYMEYYSRYIERVTEGDLLDALILGERRTVQFFSEIPNGKWNYRYAEGKWTPAEILGHLMDVERIFVFRALCFARNEKQAIPGFDEEEYARNSRAALRSCSDLTEEFKAVRASTICLFRSMNEEESIRTGIANGKRISVRALGFIIPGHEIHHMNVIRERYL